MACVNRGSTRWTTNILRRPELLVSNSPTGRKLLPIFLRSGEMRMNFLSLGVAIVFMLAAIVLGAALVGCTHTQRTVSGAAAGGVTGALIAGPIGAAVGAGGGAVAGSVIGGRS
jgi:hypothetical protein